MLKRSLARQARQITPTSTSPFIRTPISTSSQSLSSSSLSPLSIQSRCLSSKLPAPTRARILSRWYSQESAKPAEQASKESDEVSTGGNTQSETGSSSSPSSQPPKEDQDSSLKKELEAKNKEVIDLKDKYLRQVAEFRNLQERTKREVQAAKDFALQRFARDLIESIDTFDLALTNVPADKITPPPSSSSSSSSSSDTSTTDSDPNKELRQLYNGLKMTESVLINTLKKHGLERFDPSENGDKFDPNIHEATFQTPQPDKPDGTVFHTTQKGFILNGRILRAAKVGVVKNS